MDLNGFWSLFLISLPLIHSHFFVLLFYLNRKLSRKHEDTYNDKFLFSFASLLSKMYFYFVKLMLVFGLFENLISSVKITFLQHCLYPHKNKIKKNIRIKEKKNLEIVSKTLSLLNCGGCSCLSFLPFFIFIMFRAFKMKDLDIVQKIFLEHSYIKSFLLICKYSCLFNTIDLIKYGVS